MKQILLSVFTATNRKICLEIKFVLHLLIYSNEMDKQMIWNSKLPDVIHNAVSETTSINGNCTSVIENEFISETMLITNTHDDCEHLKCHKTYDNCAIFDIHFCSLDCANVRAHRWPMPNVLTTKQSRLLHARLLVAHEHAHLTLYNRPHTLIPIKLPSAQLSMALCAHTIQIINKSRSIQVHVTLNTQTHTHIFNNSISIHLYTNSTNFTSKFVVEV